MYNSRIIHSVGKRIKNFLKVSIQTKNKSLQTLNRGKDELPQKIAETRVERWFHDNGKLKAECFYQNNKLQGISNYYFPNGQVQARENYNEGVLQGLTKRYYETGTIRSEELYEKGKIKSHREYDQQGNLISTD